MTEKEKDHCNENITGKITNGKNAIHNTLYLAGQA